MLTEAMSNANLTVFAEVGLIIFVVVFAGIVIRTLCQPKEHMQELANLPNDTDEPAEHKGDTP